MPRLAGQIDVAKNEAILDAALDVLIEAGVQASMEEIARRAGVSKQTIYNHYGSRAELIRALIRRRAGEMTAPLDAPGGAEHPAEALAATARNGLRRMRDPRGTAMLRLAILGTGAMPEIGETLFETGSLVSRRKLAAFLEMETQARRLHAPDPMQAAEFFMGLVIGSRQTAALLGLPSGLAEERIDDLAREITARFLRAYAV